MPINRFFDKTGYQPEQELIQSLTDEMISINGVDAYYLPRDHVAIDPLFLQDPLSRFTNARRVAMYLKTWEGFQGDGDLMSKFGLSVADRMTMAISIREFQREVGTLFAMPRPNEGDLVYFPQSKGLFEIKFVEHEGVFYQSGTLAYYDLTLEKFEYSSEEFDTGLADIDDVDEDYSMAVQDHGFLSEDGSFYLMGEDGSILTEESFDPDNIESITQNKLFHDQAQDVLDFSENDPFSESGSSGST